MSSIATTKKKHDQVIQCLANIGALAIERHSRRGRPTLVRKFTNTVVISWWVYMFLKQSHTSLRNIVPEQFVRYMESYDIKTGCLFCDHGMKEIPCANRMQDIDIWYDTLLDKYAERQAEWASFVQVILSFFSELQPAVAVYYRWCTNFLTNKKDCTQHG